MLTQIFTQVIIFLYDVYYMTASILIINESYNFLSTKSNFTEMYHLKRGKVGISAAIESKKIQDESEPRAEALL